MESLWFVINSAFHIQFTQEIAQYTSTLFLASSFPEERVCNAFMLDGEDNIDRVKHEGLGWALFFQQEVTEYLLASYIKKEKNWKVLMGSLLPLIDTKDRGSLGNLQFYNA